MDFLYEIYELDATSVSWIMIDLMSCVFIASGSLLLIRFGFLLIESLYLLSVFFVAGISSPGMPAVVLTSVLFILINSFKLCQHYMRKSVKQVPVSLRDLYLKKFRLFSPYEFRKILSVATEIQEEQLIIRKGNKVNDLFLLIDGAVEVVLADQVKKIEGHVFFGEVSYLKKERFPLVDVRALEGARLLVLPFEALDELGQYIDDFDLRLSYTMAVDLADKLRGSGNWDSKN